MNKRTNRELLPVRIIIAVAIVAIFAASLFLYFGQETVAMQSAREAYAQFLSENPQSQDKDFIFVYEDTIIIAIRNGKVIRKEYATEADAVSAALNSGAGANYSLSGTGDGKLFVVKLFEKTDDIYALGTATLPTGADKLTIKVVSNGMIFATFEIPAEAIDRKESPVGVTIKTLAADSNVTLRENETGFAYDIDVTNLVENNTARIAVTMNAPKGLVNGTKKEAVTMYHKDKIISSTYDPVAGLISFNTANFSPFTGIYEKIPVSTLAELRYYLQRTESANIQLMANINIDLTNGDREVGEEGVRTYYNETYKEDVYYAKGYYDSEDPAQWLYFGAIVHGKKSLDLNGFKITYNGDVSKGDSALFCVDGKTNFAIYDNSGNNGAVEMKFDHYAVWAVENTSNVDIYDGVVFVAGSYANENNAEPRRALVYSSGGKINVRGGYFLYDKIESGKTNGGFNVLDEIDEPRIWIHEGAFLSDAVYRQSTGSDNSAIVLVGGKEPTKLTEQVEIHGFKDWYTITASGINGKFKYTDKILYRVGNLNAIPLNALFEGSLSNISIRVVDIIGTDLNNKSWADKYSDGNYYSNVGDVVIANGYNATNGTIDLPDTFTGPVRLELYDSSSGAIYTQLYLEVVEGKNMTTSAISPSSTNKNVCLLQDITLSAKTAINVNNGYTLFGNGFVINDARSTDNTKDGTGLILVTNGNIENANIVGYQFNSAGKVLYNNPGYSPIVLVNGSGNIYNSYIYGGSSAVQLYSGTALLDNVILDGGAFCNLYVLGSGTVTLKDCTTTSDTRGGAIGMGVVVNNQNAKVNIEGEFTQYNWLTLSQLPEDYQNIFESIYSEADYAYSYNGKTYVNMGVFFVDAESASFAFTKDVVANMVADQSANVGNYDFKVKTYGITATCYMPKASLGSPEMLGAPAAYEPSAYHVYKPVFSFTNTNKPDANKDSCDYTNGVINVGTKSNAVTLDLSGLAVKWYGRNVGFTWSVAPAATKVEGNIVTLDTANTDYTITVQATLGSRTSNGETAADNESFSYTIPVKISKLAYPAPQWVGLSATNTGSKHFWHQVGSSFSPDYQKAVPAYNGIKVTFCDTAGKEITVDFTAVQTIPTLVDGKYVLSVTGTGADFSGTYKLTITPVVTAAKDKSYEFVTCKYSKDDQTVRVYWHGTSAHDNKETSAVSMKYAFTDPNGRTIEGVTVTYDFSNSSLTTMSNSDFKNGGPSASSSGGGSNPCVTPDTLVTLADGSKKEIQHVTYADQLLVWNFYEGKYDVVPASIVMNHGYDNYQVVTLNFADGTTVNTINGHGFFDANERKYVILSDNNAADYIGHEFVKVDGNGYSTTKLVSYSVKTEYTESWSILTAEQYNCILADMWTITPAEVEGSPDYLMPFVVGADMKYDAAMLQADIEKYGLYTYEDFAGLMTQQQYEALGLSTWKIAVGKGYIAWEDILYLVSLHIG